MAKVKERKSESWKPGLFHDDGFISKNKKRKDKRMSLNLSAKKIDIDEFIPIKKSVSTLGKTKDASKSAPSKLLSPALDKKHTPQKKATPLPVSGSVKPNRTMSTPDSRKFSLADTLTAVSRKLNGTPKLKADANSSLKKNKVAGTPKLKPELTKNAEVSSEPVIKSSLKKKAQKFIDHEAEEGEEPVTFKTTKPYVKGQKKKSVSLKLNNEESDSDSNLSDGDDNSEKITGPRSFIDDEASEGDETDENDTYEDDGEDSDTFESFLAGGSGDEESGEEESIDVSDQESSVIDDEDDDSNEGNSDGNEEEDNDSDEKSKFSEIVAKKFASVNLSKKKDVKSFNGENDGKRETKSKKSDVKVVLKPVLNRKEKSEKALKVIEQLAKKTKTEDNVQKTKREMEKSDKKNSPAYETSPVTSEYVGFIKHLPSTITSEQVRAKLVSVISAENILSVILKKNNKKKSNRCFVYVPDKDSLDKLENKIFTVDKETFKIFKARESKKIAKTLPLVFLPRVPLSIDDEKVKNIIESDIGAGNVINLKRKKENDKLQIRNLIIELPNEEIMKKVVLKGSYTYKGTDIIVRQAFESGFNIPLHRVVFADIPENITEATLKKAIESKIGQGTVLMVKFSFRKKAFAFVNVNNAESLKKLLEPETKIAINGTNLQTLEFKPRPPKKRGPSKKKEVEAQAAKKQKTDQSSPEPVSKKSRRKRKQHLTEIQPNSPQKTLQPSKSVQNASKQKNQGLKQSQNNVQISSSKKLKPQQQQSLPSPSSPPKNKKGKNLVPDKKNNLNQKLEAKKNKLKNKKNKRKQIDASD